MTHFSPACNEIVAEIATTEGVITVNKIAEQTDRPVDLIDELAEKRLIGEYIEKDSSGLSLTSKGEKQAQQSPFSG